LEPGNDDVDYLMLPLTELLIVTDPLSFYVMNSSAAISRAYKEGSEEIAFFLRFDGTEVNKEFLIVVSNATVKSFCEFAHWLRCDQKRRDQSREKSWKKCEFLSLLYRERRGGRKIS